MKNNTNKVTLNQPYGVKVRRQNALPTGGTHMHHGLCQTTKSAFLHHDIPEKRSKRTESYYKRRAHCGHFHTAHQNAKRLLDGHPALRLVVVEGVLADGQACSWERHEDVVRRGVSRVAQDEVVLRQLFQELRETRKLEGRPVVLAAWAVHRPGDDSILGAAYCLREGR